MSEVTIRVEPRDGTGKGHSRKLREAGWIPAVVYGGDKEPITIQVERSTVLDLLRETGSENAVCQPILDPDSLRCYLKGRGTVRERRHGENGAEERTEE